MVVAGVLAGVFSDDWIDELTGLATSSLFVDKYSMQLLGVVQWCAPLTLLLFIASLSPFSFPARHK